MNSEQDGIEDLIEKIQELQIQQTDLLIRLRQARNKGTQATGNRNAGASAAGKPDENRSAPASTTRKLEVGDKVIIRNPRRFQANRGVITKLGASRNTVRTRSGTKILRAPWNLILDDE
jgi:hypothetical protein